MSTESRRARGRDRLGDLLRGARQAEAADQLAADPGAAREINVRRHALLGEQAALVGGAGRVAGLCGDVHRDLRRVLGRPQIERRAGGEQPDHDHGEDEHPPLTEYPQVVLNRHITP